ncbi:MAG: S4 domain-containing protein, partial [Thermosynechococcaceae cyanobacterium]
HLPLDQLSDNPRDRQKQLALEIVSQFHGMAAAQQTQAAVIAMVQEGSMANTDALPEFSLNQIAFPVKLFYVLSASGLCATSSDARRQIQGGAVKLDGCKILKEDWTAELPAELEGRILQVGKKKFIKLTTSH